MNIWFARVKIRNVATSNNKIVVKLKAHRLNDFEFCKLKILAIHKASTL